MNTSASFSGITGRRKMKAKVKIKKGVPPIDGMKPKKGMPPAFMKKKKSAKRGV
jgi:hypothetical protein